MDEILDHPTDQAFRPAYAGFAARFVAYLIDFAIIYATFFALMFNDIANRSTITGPVNMGGFLTVIYVIMALIYFYPCLTLFRFSNHAIEAAATGRSEHVTLALKNLKSNFKFVGILTIIILSFYVLMILFVALAAVMR